jgi:hypothetical protein
MAYECVESVVVLDVKNPALSRFVSCQSPVVPAAMSRMASSREIPAPASRNTRRLDVPPVGGRSAAALGIGESLGVEWEGVRYVMRTRVA